MDILHDFRAQIWPCSLKVPANQLLTKGISQELLLRFDYEPYKYFHSG